MATATATVRPKRTRIVRAQLSLWATRHEYALMTSLVVALGVFTTALLGLATSPEVNSLSVNLGITALSATITALVALITALVAYDKGERDSSAKWRNSYRVRVAQATSDYEQQCEEIENLTRLVKSLTLPSNDAEDREHCRVALVAWILSGRTISEFADSFYNEEGIGLGDEILIKELVRKYHAYPLN